MSQGKVEPVSTNRETPKREASAKKGKRPDDIAGDNKASEKKKAGK